MQQFTGPIYKGKEEHFIVSTANWSAYSPELNSIGDF